MKSEHLLRTYAEALLELALAKDQLERVNEEVELLEKLFRSDRNLRLFLESPNVRSADRQRVFETVLRGRLSDIVVNFLLLVVRRGRQFYFLDMLVEFRAIHDVRAGIVRAGATTAVPLSAQTREALRLTLEANLQKRVVLEGAVDEGILGGYVLRFGGMVADASLIKALREIRANLRNIKLRSELVHEN